jgi:ribosomal protein L37AE/L43A
MTTSSGGHLRAVPYHCPYCCDESLFPHGDAHGAWECRSCQRAFKLSFLGHLNPTHTHSPEGRHAR